jgi:hypothetical protein
MNLPAIPSERSPAMDKIQVTFIHPTESEKTITAAVSPQATPRYLINEMLKANFMSAAGNAGQYKLRNVQNGEQLLDDATLASAGLGNGGTLAVDHTTTGARER